MQYWSLFKKWFLGVTLCFNFIGVAQQYPVQITPVLIPPYSLHLSEYANSNQEKIQLQILMTDLNEPPHSITISFKLLSATTSNPIAFSTPFVSGLKEYNILPGQPLSLSNIDIRALFQNQNLAGINPQQYAKPLPQGMYNFCFQVIDAKTRRQLSSLSCTPVYLQQYQPPFLTNPRNAEVVIKQNEFQNILFQWLPAQVAPNTKYIFTLKEIWDQKREPISGFLFSRILWQEETFAPNLFYGIDKTPLIPGKRYAWQVRAISANPALPNFSIDPNDKSGIYQNNGLSEIFYFDYSQDCEVPRLMMAKNAGRVKTQILWSFSNYKPTTLYKVQYRKKDANKDWTEITSYSESAFINNLEDNTEYEYRVGSACGNVQQFSPNDTPENAFAFSHIQVFTTDSKESNNQNFQCGVMPDLDLSNQTPLQGSLGANDTFFAGDFPVTVITADGQNGVYSGTGYIVVPYLADTKILVKFDNISINNDKKLIHGYLETEYDKNETNVVGISSSFGELFGDRGIKDIKVDYVITKIEVVTSPPPGKIIIKGNAGKDNSYDSGSGEQSTEELDLGRDYAIVDASGKVWNVDEEGNVSQNGQIAPGGKNSSQNTEGIASNGKVEKYTAEGISIEWKENKNTLYAFDTPEVSNLGNAGKYPKVKDAKGREFLVPFKAVVNGQKDALEAIVHISNAKKIENADIIFKAGNGREVDAHLSISTEKKRKYTLELKGNAAWAEEDILAVLVPKDSTQKQQIISSFKLAHLGNKKINLSLVPLDESSIGKLGDIKDNIINTYKKVGIDFNIDIKPILDISDIVPGNTIQTEKTDFGSTYSEQQQKINRRYKAESNDRYVLFVTSKTASGGQNGYFRLNGQFGYIFGNAKDKTPAHEVGHGVFKLEHPWSAYGTKEGKTNLLMDKNSGEIISHLEWKQINDPKLKLYAFQKQSEGNYETDGHYSTVYLVCLMLGMDPDLAKKLAIASEAPDTTVHSEIKFELNDTWGHFDGSQQNTHSLTGGFHGIEEFFTAIRFLYTPKKNIKELGELLHRFGDTYSHAKIGNIKPEDLKENVDLDNASSETINKYIKSWEKIGPEEKLESQVKPWIKFFNHYLNKHGFNFLTNKKLQKDALKGRDLKEFIKEKYLTNKSDKYIMYGNNVYTLDHAKTDGSYPDKIYLRPKWYRIYVQNLSWLLATKYQLSSSKLDLYTFDKMIDFVSKNKVSMKGIIDYEIAKKLGKKEFYIPVFYAKPNRPLASIDAVVNTDYLQVAKDAVKYTKKYMIEQGIPEKNIVVEEINNWIQPKVNKNGVFVTEAFKITIKQ